MSTFRGSATTMRANTLSRSSNVCVAVKSKITDAKSQKSLLSEPDTDTDRVPSHTSWSIPPSGVARESSGPGGPLSYLLPVTPECKHRSPQKLWQMPPRGTHMCFDRHKEQKFIVFSAGS